MTDYNPYATDYSETPLFRSSDPETSQMGADSIAVKLTGLKAELVDQVRRNIQKYGRHPTANEAAAGNESLRKRARECVDQGYLIESGRRICSITGKMATTYKIPMED